MSYFRAFAAGFASTILFHQGLIALFYLAGIFSHAPWSMTPTPPFGVPAVISLAFWAGIWGIVLWPALRSAPGAAYWARAIVLGALGPTLVAFLVVWPLKGGALGAGWDPKLWIGGFVVNGVWGLGYALLVRTFRRIGR